MKHLLLMVLSCYTYENITSCGNDLSLYKFGNMTQAVTPQGSATIYQYDTGRTVIIPSEFGPTPYYEIESDTPSMTPAQDLFELN